MFTLIILIIILFVLIFIVIRYIRNDVNKNKQKTEQFRKPSDQQLYSSSKKNSIWRNFMIPPRRNDTRTLYPGSAQLNLANNNNLNKNGKGKLKTGQKGKPSLYLVKLDGCTLNEHEAMLGATNLPNIISVHSSPTPMATHCEIEMENPKETTFGILENENYSKTNSIYMSPTMLKHIGIPAFDLISTTTDNNNKSIV